MKQKVTELKIGHAVEDNYFKFPQQLMADIVDALHNSDKVVLDFIEGVALEELNYKEKKFLHILKELCERNNWPLDKIQFVSPNLVQNKSVWPSIKLAQYPDHFLHAQNLQVNTKKQIDKTFGMFVGRSSWERLIIGSHIFKHHKDKTMQTYRNYLDDPGNMLNMDTERLLWNLSVAGRLTKSNLKDIFDFISEMPFTYNNKHDKETNLQWDSGALDNDLLECYNKIFVDVVCEKTIAGKTFFPTEKTSRPLVTKTPFLIMAAPDFIKNLKKLNFRSYNRWWSEDYDQQQGLERAESIQGIIDDLAKLDKKQLEDMHQQMQPILEYNYKNYMETAPEKIHEVFSQKPI